VYVVEEKVEVILVAVLVDVLDVSVGVHRLHAMGHPARTAASVQLPSVVAVSGRLPQYARSTHNTSSVEVNVVDVTLLVVTVLDDVTVGTHRLHATGHAKRTAAGLHVPSSAAPLPSAMQ
jgi:hypothetical protein